MLVSKINEKEIKITHKTLQQLEVLIDGCLAKVLAEYNCLAEPRSCLQHCTVIIGPGDSLTGLSLSNLAKMFIVFSSVEMFHEHAGGRGILKRVNLTVL